MKKTDIKIPELMEAPIDEKNISGEAILEDLFDEGNYISGTEDSLGFVLECPVYVEFRGNNIVCTIVDTKRHGVPYCKKEIIKRVTGYTMTGRKSSFSLIDDRQLAPDESEENRLVYNVTSSGNTLWIACYWNTTLD